VTESAIATVPAPIVDLVNAAGLTPGLLVEHLGASPDTEDIMVARTLGLEPAQLQAIRDEFRSRNRDAVERELTDPESRSALELLPFDSGERVVIVGDSISMAANSWASLLATALEPRGVEVINRAVSGRTSTETLAHFGRSLSLRPDWVIIMIGANDIRRQVTTDGSVRMLTNEESLRNQLELQSWASGEAKVITVPSTLPIDDRRSYVNRQAGHFWIDREMEEANGMLVAAVPGALDLRTRIETFDGYWAHDGVHPSAEGQAQVFREVLELLSSETCVFRASR
jgi:lysophospholipase L1-like esterase